MPLSINGPDKDIHIPLFYLAQQRELHEKESSTLTTRMKNNSSTCRNGECHSSNVKF